MLHAQSGSRHNAFEILLVTFQASLIADVPPRGESGDAGQARKRHRARLADAQRYPLRNTACMA
jgi:hypothetical protein